MTLEVVKMPTKEDSEAEQGRKIASNVIRTRFLMEFSKIAFPYFVFLMNFGIIAYSIWNPDNLRIISSGIFFVFSIVFLRYAKMLWKE